MIQKIITQLHGIMAPLFKLELAGLKLSFESNCTICDSFLALTGLCVGLSKEKSSECEIMLKLFDVYTSVNVE